MGRLTSLLAEAYLEHGYDSLAGREVDLGASNPFRLIALAGQGAESDREFALRPQAPRASLALSVGPGGVGKTTLIFAEALSVCTGLPLLGVRPEMRGKVLILNADEDFAELDRRLRAACTQHGVSVEEARAGIPLVSGRDMDLVFVKKGRDGPRLDTEKLDWLVEFMLGEGIIWVVIDPLAQFHQGLDENSNDAMGAVAEFGKQLAHRTGAAVTFVHHPPKGGQQTSRGASALVNAARFERHLRNMTEAEADSLGVETNERPTFVAIETTKNNLGPLGPLEWVRIVPVTLEGGQSVQGIERWIPPDPYAAPTDADLAAVRRAMKRPGHRGGWRLDIQTGDLWIGCAMATALGLNLDSKPDRTRAKSLISHWLETGALRRVMKAKNSRGDLAPFVEVSES